MFQKRLYTKDLQVKITRLYEDPAFFSKVLSAKSEIDPIKKYSNLFESMELESDDDDIYEVLDNEMANIENEEEIKRYLTVNPYLWMKADAKREEACEMLQNKQTGHFIVRESSQADTFALSIRVPDNLTKPVNHYLLLKSDLGFEAQGSNLYFPTLPSLLAHFCSYQSGGMPCLLRPPKKKTAKCSHVQGYLPTSGSGEDGEGEIFSNSRTPGVVRGDRGVAPALRQIHSVPVQTNMKNPRVLPPPPVTCLVPNLTPKAQFDTHNQLSHPSSFSHLNHPSCSSNNAPNEITLRRYNEPLHQLSRSSDPDDSNFDYASVECDTPPDSIHHEAIPKLPPRTYLNQNEVEYSDPILSPDTNYYDEPGEILHGSIPIHRVRTTDESHSNHAHGFRPPPIPPKTASMLIETGRLATTTSLQNDQDLDSSHEGNNGILHNCIRLNDTPPLSKYQFAPITQDNLDTDVYLDMDPKEVSSEAEKDIELQVHHTIKHQNGSSFEESSADYVNVIFNTLATMKGIKQLEQPFKIGQSNQVPLGPLTESYQPKLKDQNYNTFTATNKHPALSAMPSPAPQLPLRLKNERSESRKYTFGERMLSRPSREEICYKQLTSPQISNDRDCFITFRRSNSADLLETPVRKLGKPPLLPKPKFSIEKGAPRHRRSSSSHECYEVAQNFRSDLMCKESLSRKRSAPSPIEVTKQRPILRGCQYSPEQFSDGGREPRKVNFSGSTEVRELARQMDQKFNIREHRSGRSRSPVAPNRPSHPPPPPPPPPPQNRRYSASVSQTSFTNLPHSIQRQVEVNSNSRHRVSNNLNSSIKGSTVSSAYMQPSSNSKINQWPGHVRTLNRAQFQSEKREAKFKQDVSGEMFIRALKDTKRDHLKGTFDDVHSQESSGKPHSKPQSESSNQATTEIIEVIKKDEFDAENVKLRSSKYKKQRTPTQRVVMYISRLNGRAHPMGNKISSFNKAILKRQQGDGKVNIEKTLEQVRRFIDGVKKHLLTEKVEVMTRKFREQIVEHGTSGESEDISEEDLNERLDAICENCLYNIILKPIYEHLIKQIKDYLTRCGDLGRISSNIDKGVFKPPVYLGIRENLIPPDQETRNKVRKLFKQLTDLYSPLRKLEILLDAVKLVYQSIRDKKDPNKSNLSIGADDFLPIFIYTLIHTGMKEIEVEYLYTWNLVDQNLLSGEGGYYLTTLCTAIEVLKQSDFNSKDENCEVSNLFQV